MKDIATGIGEVVLMIVGAGALMGAWAVLGPFTLPALVIILAVGSKVYKFFK